MEHREALWGDIDWSHTHRVQALHWGRILAAFVPQLAHCTTEIYAEFRGKNIAKHRMRVGRKTKMQPFETNSEHEIENEGCKNSMLDFEGQAGVDKKTMGGNVFWHCGDGGSIAAQKRVMKYRAQEPEDYSAFRNRLPPIPELWHVQSTKLSEIANNHFGRATSQDPSSLSKCSTAAGRKRPADPKKAEFYKTSESLNLYFEAMVLNI